MISYKKLSLYLVGALALSFASCESEDPVVESEAEVITDLTLIFFEVDETENILGETFIASAVDSDGITPGRTPIISPIMLESGKRYKMTLNLFNRIENKDITPEFFEESDKHQFFFLGAGFTSSSLNIVYDDPDILGSVGVKTILTVSASPSTNNTTIRLVHRRNLDKDFPGATSPNFENFAQAGGETDLDITFPVVIN